MPPPPPASAFATASRVTTVRSSLERLWAMHLFESIHVDEVNAPAGVRLRYRLDRRPLHPEIRHRRLEV